MTADRSPDCLPALKRLSRLASPGERQVYLLTLLGRIDGPITQIQMEKQTGMGHRTIATILRGLREAGLAELVSPHHGWQVTPSGSACLDGGRTGDETDGKSPPERPRESSADEMSSLRPKLVEAAGERSSLRPISVDESSPGQLPEDAADEESSLRPILVEAVASLVASSRSLNSRGVKDLLLLATRANSGTTGDSAAVASPPALPGAGGCLTAPELMDSPTAPQPTDSPTAPQHEEADSERAPDSRAAEARAALVAAGIREPALSKLAARRYVTAAYVRAHVETTESLGQAIYRMLNQWTAPDVTRYHVLGCPCADCRPSDAECEPDFDDDAETEGPADACPAAPEPELPPAAVQAWALSSTGLRVDCGHKTFERRLRGLRLAAYDADERRFTVDCRDPATRAWMERGLRASLERALTTALGQPARLALAGETGPIEERL